MVKGLQLLDHQPKRLILISLLSLGFLSGPTLVRLLIELFIDLVELFLQNFYFLGLHVDMLLHFSLSLRVVLVFFFCSYLEVQHFEFIEPLVGNSDGVEIFFSRFFLFPEEFVIVF